MAIGQAGQDPICPAGKVMFQMGFTESFESSQCNSSLFNRVAGQVEVPLEAAYPACQFQADT